MTHKEILGYTAFFLGVFAVFIGIACYAYFSPRGYSVGMVATWQDYDDGLSPVTVTRSHLSFYEHQKLRQAAGHWTDKTFFAASLDDRPGEIMVARELPNEDLRIDMSAFDPGDHRQLTCVMLMRGTEIAHPYPVGKPGEKVSYPPPKGLIREGMLEADLEALPWQPYTREEPDYVAMESSNRGSYHGSSVFNNWPSVWKYKSNDPNLPELQVTVEKGRVTHVIGGAEGTPGPSYIPDTNSPGDGAGASSASPDDRSWGRWLFDLLFKS